jgi:sialic acid synthase SpsE
MPAFRIGNRVVGDDQPAYFIAEIASNHDGDLGRAVELIHLAADLGADAAKFQHFRAATLVSPEGFARLGSQVSHQAKWEASVFEVYDRASLSLDWTDKLVEACTAAGIEFFSSPYDMASVDALDPFVRAYKVGSGEITWHESLRHMASKGKPMLLAAGASTMDEVTSAVAAIKAVNEDLCLMQCNTNYTGDLENFEHINLNVLATFRQQFPGAVLGLSDHTPGHATVLGAVALGARVIEKHFTDDNSRPGPDHPFSMNPKSWREMVDGTRQLEASMGDGVKRVEENELETVVVQRRCLRASRDIAAGELIGPDDLLPLRPAPPDGIPPYRAAEVLGKRLRRQLSRGEHLTIDNIE